MSLNVVLINPPSACVDDDHLEPPLGLLYIASALRAHGLEPVVYDMTGCVTAEDIEARTRLIPEGDVFGISCYCTNYNYVKGCIRHIRSRGTGSLIVLGGPNPSALPEFTLSDSGCDCVIVGEGEDAFLKVINLYKDGLAIPRVITGIGRSDIDSYDMPSWELIDLGGYSRILSGGKSLSIISSRGCGHGCAHCNSTVMGGGRPARFRSPEKVCEEIACLKSMGFSRLRFNDDNFTGNPGLPGLLKAIEGEKIKYRIFARLEELTAENCRLLAKSGCLHISVGIESLDPDNLRALGKSSQHGHEGNLRNAADNGITIRAFFMVGLPFDTADGIRRHFEAASRLPFDEYSIYPLIPYPGTTIARDPARFGYEIVDRDFTHYVQIGKNKSTVFAMRHRLFTPEDVRAWHSIAEEMLQAGGKRPQAQSGLAL